MKTGGKVGSIGVWKGPGANFPFQFPSYPVPGDCFYLHFSGALEVDSFGSLLEVHTFIYIYSGIIYAFG